MDFAKVIYLKPRQNGGKTEFSPIVLNLKIDSFRY